MKMIAFGASEGCIDRMEKYLNREKAEVIAFFDDFALLQGTKTRTGIPIFHPNEVNALNFDYILVLPYVANSSVIKKQLISLGVDEQNVVALKPRVQRFLRDVVRYENAIMEIISKLVENGEISIGDIVLKNTFLPKYQAMFTTEVHDLLLPYYISRSLSFFAKVLMSMK